MLRNSNSIHCSKIWIDVCCLLPTGSYFFFPFLFSFTLPLSFSLSLSRSACLYGFFFNSFLSTTTIGVLGNIWKDEFRPVSPSYANISVICTVFPHLNGERYSVSKSFYLVIRFSVYSVFFRVWNCAWNFTFFPNRSRNFPFSLYLPLPNNKFFKNYSTIVSAILSINF